MYRHSACHGPDVDRLQSSEWQLVNGGLFATGPGRALAGKRQRRP